jgi:hypothetical protein
MSVFPLRLGDTVAESGMSAGEFGEKRRTEMIDEAKPAMKRTDQPKSQAGVCPMAGIGTPRFRFSLSQFQNFSFGTGSSV